MKSKLHIIMALAGVLTVSSCSDWFDISPKTDVKAEELFESENGFMSALTGIYVLMTGENAYGKELTFGIVDQLAQLYDYIPEGATDKNAIYNYTQTTSGGYNTKGRMAQVWLTSYNIIANANNLLKWLDLKGEEIIYDESRRDMIRGEVLAIRATMHFELLRLWGPVNYAGNAEVRGYKCIPYRTVTDKSKQPLLEAETIIENIISDLEAAKEALSFEKDSKLGEYSDNGDRRFRINYHAVCAMLARVHNYAGNSEQALTYALDVIDNCGLSLSSDNSGDPVIFSEVIFGVNLYQMVDNLSTYFDDGDKINTKYHITYATMNSIFEIIGSESEDMRARNAAILRNSDKQMAVSNKYIENDNEVIPVIRLPEMYYIVCENAEAEVAERHINLVRNRRGISSANNVQCNTRQQVEDALNREYRKEFYAEGQYFHFLKSHGLTGALIYSPTVSLTEENFIFPLPDAEKEYGWTDAAIDNTTEEDLNNPE